MSDDDDRTSARPGRCPGFAERGPQRGPPRARHRVRVGADVQPGAVPAPARDRGAARGAGSARGRRRRPDRRARRRPGRAARDARAGRRPAAVRDALRRARDERLRHAARGRLRRLRHLDGLRPPRRARRSASRCTHNETFSDWSRRPLTEAQIAYAADDVRYLFAVADALVARLDEMGRRSWAEDEIARRYGPDATIEPDPQRAYLKVARRGRLSGRQLAALRAVAAWREEEARSRDLPPGWVLKDPSVVEVARRNPADAAALGKLRGLGNLSAPAAQRLLDALARGGRRRAACRARASCRPASPAASPRPRRSARCSCARAARARTSRPSSSPRAPSWRASSRRWPTGTTSTRCSSGWRRELVGAELRELVQGNVALALEPAVAVRAHHRRCLPAE